MKHLRVQELSGSFYEMGKQHGQAYHDAIHHFTEDRIRLSMGERWTGRNLSRDAVLALADACVEEHQAYCPELMEELQGTADATGLSLGALIINNGFTDFVDTVYAVGDITKKAKTPAIASDNCTAFIIPKAASFDGHAMYGQTWDMHDSATEHVILLRGKPDNAPNFLAFTITGCIGMIGMNDAGIAVGINNITDEQGQVGVTWPFVIRKILMQDNIEDALACITDARLAGAHNYMLIDNHGNGYEVEAMASCKVVEKVANDPIVHTNHCLVPETQAVERERTPESLSNSIKRLERATELIYEHQCTTPRQLMELTRDANVCQRSQDPWHIESSGAAIMRPATGDFWAVWGPPPDNEYEHFKI